MFLLNATSQTICVSDSHVDGLHDWQWKITQLLAAEAKKRPLFFFPSAAESDHAPQLPRAPATTRPSHHRNIRRDRRLEKHK